MMYVIWREAVHLIGGKMSPETIFNLHLILGYAAWLLCFGVYVMPRLKSMDLVAAQRAIATLHNHFRRRESAAIMSPHRNLDRDRSSGSLAHDLRCC
jgi:hypothetical protein